MVAESVGFGYAGVGSSGAGGGGGTRRAIENVIDGYGAALYAPGNPGSSGNIFNTDFDSGSAGHNTLSGLGSSAVPLPNEGTTAGGDSGGPLIVNGEIVGVLSGGSTANSVYGDISWWTGTISYASFIQTNAPGAIFGMIPPVDTPSNASFSSSVDQDVLNIDFGLIPFQTPVSAVDFDIANLPVGVTVAPLDLLSVTGSGDTAALTTDVAPFTDLLPGGTNAFSAMLDSTVAGDFSASYDLSFTDELGTNQTLTVNLTGEVSEAAPGVPDLFYDATTGDVYIDPRDAGSVIGYQLTSDGAFLPGNFSAALGGVATASTNELSEATFGGITEPTGIGAVLAPGLSLADVVNTLTVRDASTALGSPTVPFSVAMVCLVGDADCDGDISGDIFPAFSNFTGPGTFTKSRANGDVDAHPFGDGDVDVSDLLLMFGSFTGPLDGTRMGKYGGLVAAEAGDANIPDLIYDPATGEVILDVDGSGIIGYVLKNGDNSFVFGNHVQMLAGVKTSVAGELSEAAFASSVGTNSIGNVFPLGMDLAALTAYLTVNDVSRSLGAPVVPFDLVVLGPAVPESSTFALAALGLMGLAVCQARKKQQRGRKMGGRR